MLIALFAVMRPRTENTVEMTGLRSAATLAGVLAIGMLFVVMPLVNRVLGGTASEEG